jgi:hypothetical protein
MQLRTACNSALVRTIAETITSASGGDSAAAQATGEAVLIYLRAPKHLSAVFSLQSPITSIRIYAVSTLSNAVLATVRADSGESAILRNLVNPDCVCAQFIQLEFEGLDDDQKVVATSPGIFLEYFLAHNEFHLLAPLPEFQVDSIPIRYSAVLEV